MKSSPLRRFTLLGLVALSVAVGGCSVVPREVRKEIDRSLTFGELKANPDAYAGRVVALGGEIAETNNLEHRTELMVVQKPLGRRDIPIETDRSEGRFLVDHPGYLDPAIYRSGRYLTVVGEVRGGRTGKVGEAEVSYPVISSRFLYLWPHPHCYYGAYYPYYPYYYPYWYPYFYPYPFHFYLGLQYSYYRWYPSYRYDPYHPWPYRYHGPPLRHRPIRHR
jgi:outer membrane lipoprotein